MNNKTSTAREKFLMAAGAIGLVAIVVGALSTLAYKFFERFVPAEGRLDMLVILAWGMLFFFVLGIGFALSFMKGVNLYRNHPTTSSRPNDKPAAYTPTTTTIFEPYERLPTEFSALSPEMNARVIKALNSGEDEVNA